MNTLRIVFYGTPEFAVTILDTINNGPHEVVGVVTAPDKPAGRGRQLHQSAVKQYASSKDLTVLQPTNLKSQEFLDELEALAPDVQVIVAFRMLPKQVWSLPRKGTFNLHASLLPKYRGAAPINWAIINRERSSGVTTFFIDEKIDTGEIILQEPLSIAERETAGSLHDRLMDAGAGLVEKTLNLIAKDEVTTKKQDNRTAKADAPKLDKRNTTIDWSRPVEEIDAFIRGLFPYPVAKALLHDGKTKQVKVYEAEPTKISVAKLPAGSIVVQDNLLLVAAADFMLEIKKLQLPGKKALKAIDLLNGYSFSHDAKFVNRES